MPWKVFAKGDEFCVYKLTEAGDRTGEPLGCHPSKEKAMAQMRALYVHVPDAKAVKFAEGSDTELIGLLAPYGGPFNGSDIQGERFSAKTDFCFDWFTERPLLYHHGLDPDVGTAVVGRIKALPIDDVGVWMKAQLDKGSKYYAAIKKLIEQGALQLSSGAMSHLTKVAKTGDILRWPLVEGTLTPTPANFLATVDFATAKAHFKAIDIDIDSDPLKAEMAAATMMAMMREMADQMGMDVSESEMTAMMADMDSEMPEAEMRVQMRKKLQAKKQEMMAEQKSSNKAAPDSYEELIACLQRMVNPYNPFGTPNMYAQVAATYPDHIIVERCQDGEKSYWKVPYKLDDNGMPMLGTAVEVEETYVAVPAKALLPEISLTTQSDTVSHYAAALVERTKGLNERRTKEGRVLSTATRNRLANCVQTMNGAATELQALLDSTDPALAKALVDFGRLSLDIDLLEFEAALTA